MFQALYMFNVDCLVQFIAVTQEAQPHQLKQRALMNDMHILFRPTGRDPFFLNIFDQRRLGLSRYALSYPLE